MRDYVIITDSGCDLSKELVEELKIEVVPMRLAIDGKEYRHYHDCRELSMDEFYAKIQKGHIGKTSCANIADIEKVMRQNAKDDKDILYLSFSSKMSSSYQIAVIAANETRAQYPKCKIKVINTLSGSSGLGMLAYIAAKEKESGKTIEEVAEYITQIRHNICHYFVVKDLMYLQKSGRISSFGAVLGTALGIKPVFKLSQDGTIAMDIKVRGQKNVMRHLIHRAEESNGNLFFICHAKAKHEADELAAEIKNIQPKATIKINEIGPIIGNNTGIGTIGIMFLGDKR